MRKVIAAINMTLDGYCDHTAVDADAELHQYYTDLLNNAGVLLYGRITYLLMESFWPALITKPSGTSSLDEFAVAIDRIPKVVFSHTLKTLTWYSARLAINPLEEEVKQLRQMEGKDIYVGSPGLISALTALRLIDEYQLCIHPVIAGSGLPLFRGISEKVILKRSGSKILGSGAFVMSYESQV